MEPTSEEGGDQQRTSSVAVIGSGPAGWTAALYLGRAQLAPLVFEGELDTTGGSGGEHTQEAAESVSDIPHVLPGGQLMTTTEVENYPGFPNGGIGGPELVLAMQKQAEDFGAITISETVTKIVANENPEPGRRFTLEACGEGGKCHKFYDFDAVILATGATAKYLGLPSEMKFLNRGVSACATCDGALPRFRRKPLVVVGGGDTACEEALFLARFASSVLVVHRRDSFRASKVMAERVLAHEKIDVAWDSVVEEIVGTDEAGVSGVRIKNVKTGEVKDVEAAGYFAAIGHRPNSELVQGGLADFDAETRYVIPTPPGTPRTKTPGLFVAGDVADSVYRQAITAAGAGCAAGIEATRFLQEHAGNSRL
jgi:thioredoxin reductase (NADPH)